MRLLSRIPELRGPWLATYKALWWLMLLVSVLALTAGQWRLTEYSSRIEAQLYSVGLLPAENGHDLAFDPLSPDAKHAGVQPDSVLLAVDGRPMSLAPDAYQVERIARAVDGRPGQVVKLRVRAPDGRIIDARITRGPQHLAAADREAPITHKQRKRIELASSTLDALIVMTGAILLFWRRPSDPVAALLSFGLLAVPANDIAYLIPDATWHEPVESILDAVPMVCILLGMTVFPHGTFVPRSTLLIFPAIMMWGALFMFGEAGMPLALQLGLVLPGLIVTTGSLAWRYAHLEPGETRQQVKWVMLGFGAFFAAGMVEFGLLLLDNVASSNGAHFAVLIADNVLSVVEGACIVGGLLVSLLRYRLYDVDAAISRSAVYAGLTVVLFAIFAAGETLIQTLGQQWFGSRSGATGGAIAAGLAALFLVPLHHRLSDLAKRRFQRDLSRLRAELPELLFAVRDISDPAELAENALRLAMRGVRASRGAILLASDGRVELAHAEGLPSPGLAERMTQELPTAQSCQLARTNDQLLPVCLPLITPGGAMVGWLALGPHPDGSLYGKDDRRALEQLAMPLARALSVTIERARRERHREVERRALTERLTQLEQALAQVVSTPREAGAA